jgi:DNA-binding transcriptional MerR regulator
LLDVNMATQLSHKRAFDPPPAIPDRLYFKIGDVAHLCDVETYVLRFWETQFPQLKPNKSGTGQRLYRRRDVELALEIKNLVHAQGYTLSGARQVLELGNRRNSNRTSAPIPLPLPSAGHGRSCARFWAC